MADSSCSHWWHAPFYFAMSLVLVLVSITTPNHSRPDIHSGPSAHVLAVNASRALRARGGFSTIAALLQISPELLISRPESTLFAIQDSALSNLSIPPWALRQLLRFHAAPSALPMAELSKKPTGFCFQSLLQNKSLVITKNDANTGSIMINDVLVSQPDLFLEGSFSVHGVVGPFEPLPSDACNFPTPSNVVVSDPTDKIEWNIIVSILSSHGFVSFAIGLNSILDGILKDYTNLRSVTIFAPPNSGFISSPSPLLDRIVKIHILRQRFTHMELLDAGNSSLKTLVPGYDLKVDTFSEFLDVNGVEISRPDYFLSNKFVIHGISKAFDSEEFST